MTPPDLHRVADILVRRAWREGILRPCDIRVELARARLPEAHHEQVVALAGAALVCRKGRYYPSGAAPAPERHEQQIQSALGQLIRHYRVSAAQQERRGQDRVDFIQPIKVRTEDGRDLNLLSRDLSATGIRLVSAFSLLGRRLHVFLPADDRGESHHFLIRVVWSCAVGDDLYENGGMFLEVFPRTTPRLRLVHGD